MVSTPIESGTEPSDLLTNIKQQTTKNKTTNLLTPHVSITEANEVFNELRRELSNISSLHRTLTSNNDNKISTSAKDLEKQISTENDEEEEIFDLLSYMKGELEERDNNGFKRKHVGVIWDDLSVIGVGGLKIYIRTFPDAIKEFLLSPYSLIKSYLPTSPPETKKLLHLFNGHLTPGEMVLVLGRPGSGCSTFLKTIANQRGGYISVNGTVSYGNFTSEEMLEKYKGEVVYNQEDDIHHATLTVAQTLLFALNNKTPSTKTRLPFESKEIFKTKILNLILKMLAIEHTRDTLVGSVSVRGVSGGERKRVSIAEMMCTRASICSFDNSSRGLDSATALDFVKSLRILTDVNNVATLVSLYQAGEGIYEQFDKVLLIDEGRQIYFGPSKEARAYMASLGYADLPRQTTADYLTGCTDPTERQFSPSFDPASIPATPQALESAFVQSEIYQKVLEDKEIYRKTLEGEDRREDFVSAVKNDKRRGVEEDSVYTVAFWTQVRWLVVRQLQIVYQNKLELYITFFDSAGIALISGILYLSLPLTAAGAFVRGSLLFLAVLFNAFHAFNEIPTQMLGRPILWKQNSFAFYRPAAMSISSTIAGAPIAALQIFVFCIITYFMCGLYASGSAFIIFYISIMSGYFALSAIFRLMGTLCSGFDIAGRIAAIVITLMVLYGGYLIPVFSMKRWLYWLYYLNPMNYAFQATMANEFSRIDLVCEGAFIIPHNFGNLTKYPTALGLNQACTLPGSTPGNPIVSGSAYILANFNYESGNIGRNIAITLVFFVIFNFLQAWAVEVLRYGADSPQINTFAKETEETKNLNSDLKENQVAFRKGEKEQDMSGFVVSQKPFTWEAVSYTVPVKGGDKLLLDEIFGYCKPGTITALMGASGAGKSTLLDVLANRKNIGVVRGTILVDGRKVAQDFQRSTAYCEQNDSHESTATVREALRFSAYLRQPSTVSKAEKDRYVEEIIQLLELEDLADAMIGSPGFGLGVEARKRVTIGVELASKPQLLLFLDEPTTGLEGNSAMNIIKFLKKLSAVVPVLTTIHQPNALLFEQFDRLLLLRAGGRCVYFGENGPDSCVIRDYFAKSGALCPEKANVAEYILEAIGAGSQRQVGSKDWADRWLESSEFVQIKQDINEMNRLALQHEQSTDPRASDEYTSSFLHQARVVITRQTIAFYRSPSYTFSRLFNHCAIALLLSLTFLQLSNTLVSLQYRVFAIFFVTILPAIIISSVEPAFIGARETFVRESSSKMYSPVVFALGQIVAEMPYSFLCTVCFYILFYFPIGFNTSSNRAGYTFLMILGIEIFSVTLGQGIASISPSVFVAATQNPFILIIGSLFCGVTISKGQIPKWLVWMYELDPFTRMISGLTSNELHNLPVVCTASEFITFNPPVGQTCATWMKEFIQLAGGYLEESTSNATSACKYCTYSVGDEFYNQLNISFDTRWRDLGILIGFIFFNMLITILASRYLKYSKR